MRLVLGGVALAAFVAAAPVWAQAPMTPSSPVNIAPPAAAPSAAAPAATPKPKRKVRKTTGSRDNIANQLNAAEAHGTIAHPAGYAPPPPMPYPPPPVYAPPPPPWGYPPPPPWGYPLRPWRRPYWYY